MRHVFGRDLSASDLPIDLVATFARGWAVTRGVAPPVDDGGAWRVEVGNDDEARRYVFPCPSAALAALAARIDEPRILLKVPAAVADVAALLAGHWQVERTGTIMTAACLPAIPRSLPSPYRLEADWRDDVYFTRLIAADGEEVARGRMTLVDGLALHDRIRVANDHQRRGLGRAIMHALGAEARRHGIDHGLLAATDAGRALYETLDWQARSPWTTAQIRPGPTA